MHIQQPTSYILTAVGRKDARCDQSERGKVTVGGRLRQGAFRTPNPRCCLRSLLPRAPKGGTKLKLTLRLPFMIVCLRYVFTLSRKHHDSKIVWVYTTGHWRTDYRLGRSGWFIPNRSRLFYFLSPQKKSGMWRSWWRERGVREVGIAWHGLKGLETAGYPVPPSAAVSSFTRTGTKTRTASSSRWCENGTPRLDSETLGQEQRDNITLSLLSPHLDIASYVNGKDSDKLSYFPGRSKQ